MTKKALFIALNSHGHLNSCIGLADRLKHDHGFRTIFLIVGPTFDNIKNHGHELVTLEELHPYEDYEIDEDDQLGAQVDEEKMKRLGRVKRKFHGAHKWPQILLRNLIVADTGMTSAAKMTKFVAEEMADNHDALAKAITEINPDIMILDVFQIPQCVSDQETIPWVRLFSANSLMLTRPKLPDGLRPPPGLGVKLYDKAERTRLRNDEPEKWQSILDEWRKAMEQLRAANSRQDNLRNAQHSPHLNIYLCPEALDYDQDDDILELPPRWLRCGSLIRKSSNPTTSAEIKAWEQKIDDASKGKKAIVFFSLGSLASVDVKLMKRFVEMFREDKNRLYIISKGVNGDKYLLYDHNMIGANHVPQTYCLTRSDMAIVHGGNNSITECMYYGLPMIVLPIFADQLDNAQRVEDLGYGRRLDVFKSSKEELFQAMGAILQDGNLIKRMRDIGAKMQGTDDAEKVIALLNRLIEEKHLDEELIDGYRNKQH